MLNFTTTAGWGDIFISKSLGFIDFYGMFFRI